MEGIHSKATKQIALGKGADTDTTAVPKGVKAKKADKKGGTASADATYLEVSSHREWIVG